MKKLVVMSLYPVFDDWVALYVALWGLAQKGVTVEEVEVVYNYNFHPDKAVAEYWKSRDAIIIDAYRDEKYQVLQGSSASAVMMERYPEAAKSDALQGLVLLTDANNDSGLLKQNQGAFAFLLREAFHLNIPQEEVRKAMLHVVYTWCNAQEGATHKDRSEETLKNDPAFRGILSRTDYGFSNQFTMAQYLLHLYLVGLGAEEIGVLLAFWFDIERRSKQMNRRLREDTQTNLGYDLISQFAGGRAALVKHPSECYTRALFHEKVTEARGIVLALRRCPSADPRSQRVQILTRTNDPNLTLPNLANLAEFLQLLEGDARSATPPWYWHFEARQNMLLNGAKGFPAPATWLSDANLVLLIEVLVFHMKHFDDRLAIEQFVARMIEGEPQKYQARIDRKRLADLLESAQPKAPEILPKGRITKW